MGVASKPPLRRRLGPSQQAGRSDFAPGAGSAPFDFDLASEGSDGHQLVEDIAWTFNLVYLIDSRLTLMKQVARDCSISTIAEHTRGLLTESQNFSAKLQCDR